MSRILERRGAPDTPPLFPPELRTASVVPRWSVVYTLNRDTVANHSYYVTFYAYQIARAIGWSGPWDDLMFTALVHDLDETVTGDVVSPAKHAIVDPAKFDAYVTERMRERMPTVLDRLQNIRERLTPPQLTAQDVMADREYQDLPGEIVRIVAAADRLDAVLFLTVERRTGNQHVAKRIPEATERLREAWLRLPADPDEVQRLWFEEVCPAIGLHESDGGHGV